MRVRSQRADGIAHVRVWQEISSCGCLQTMDVLFPAVPALLHQAPHLVYNTLEPLLAYANNETGVKYTLAFAPHHLGYYPIANLPVKLQENMPNEETANLLLMLAGQAKVCVRVKLSVCTCSPTRCRLRLRPPSRSPLAADHQRRVVRRLQVLAPTRFVRALPQRHRAGPGQPAVHRRL